MARRTTAAASFVAVLPLLTSCAALENNSQGPMQPQSVSGPCEVKRFFLLSLRAVPAEMTIANTGQACTFTLVNPALNVVINAALPTGIPRHGQFQTSLTPGSRQAVVSYTPAPGYAGPDTFEVTLEPNAVSIKVNVTVTSAR